MGGAQRNQRKKNQRNANQATKAIASARGASSGRAKWIVSAVAVIVIAGAIIGGVLLTNSSKQAAANDVIPTADVKSNYQVKPNPDGTVTAGKPDAKVKLDFYEDLLCPACGQFNKLYGQEVEQKLESGDVQVKYHVLPFLNENSSPPGYSERSSAALYSVAVNSPDKFAAYESSLYKTQAQEQTAGYNDDQLISLGKRLGVGGSFEQDVRSGKYKDLMNKSLQSAGQDMQKATGKLATPTILHDGKNVEVSQKNWLEDLINKAKG
ncbi:DsbA family protein [Sciscionella marina]|uniref:DsbA family protein n=1 Tax=Sciscionella marina TaxID=508770 RepID=UPI00035D1EA8|nr:thioredoxin domain-containing protein [Sciscionella marina]